jgi:hypothetical protein
MPSKNGQKSEDLAGKIYQVRAYENAKTKPGYMQGRLKDGDLLLCLERSHAKVHRYAPLWCDVTGMRVYPEAFWFLSDPIGELVTSWQPTPQEFRRLWGELVLKHIPLAGVMSYG